MQPAQKRTAETQRGAERRRGSVLCISSCRLLCVYVVNCLFVLLLTGIRPIAAQQAPPQRTPTYTVESQLVQIFLTVQEGSRRITGLNLSEFSLAEDGKPQPIDHMDSEQVPLQVALLFDTSESMTESLKETQEAATLFVESMKPGDRVTLIPFNSNIRTIPQLTDDFEPVLRAIRGTRAEYRTKLYDAILYAMKVLSDKEGRKAIVVFSDGGDTASTAALPLALNASSRYGYPIYTVSAGPAIRSQAFRQVLRQLAETNNGKVFFAENPRELRSAFLEVSAELRAAYVLYYYTLLQPDDRWHEFIVKSRQSAIQSLRAQGLLSRQGRQRCRARQEYREGTCPGHCGSGRRQGKRQGSVGRSGNSAGRAPAGRSRGGRQFQRHRFHDEIQGAHIQGGVAPG